MGRRTRLVKLSEEEYNILQKARKLVMEHGTRTFSDVARKTITDSALGNYIHLGSLLIIEHINRIPR